MPLCICISFELPSLNKIVNKEAASKKSKKDHYTEYLI
jgi:hypothetical protein